MSEIENDVMAIQGKFTRLSRKLEDYKVEKKTLEKENGELAEGYRKISKAKGQLWDENEAYICSLKRKAGSFSPALKCVHSFCDSVQELMDNEKSQRRFSALDEAMKKIKIQIFDNDNAIDILNDKIKETKAEIEKLRTQLNNLGG